MKSLKNGEIEVLAKIPGEGFLEGPAYVPEHDMLYFVEIEAGWISRVSMDGKYEKVHDKST